MSPPRPSPAEQEAQERLEALARTDKWYLSAGDGCLWAPPFPNWLHRPGFWDEAHIYHYPMQPLFTVALVGPSGEADPLGHAGADWRPDRLRVRWRSRSGLTFTEFRYILPGGRFCSAWRTEEELGWPNPVFRESSLVAYTAVEGPTIRDLAHSDTGLRWGTTLRDHEGHRLDVDSHLTFELLPPRGHHAVAPDVLTHLDEATEGACCGVLRSEGRAEPDWDLSPFVECWREREQGVLGGSAELRGVSDEGHVHLVAVLPLRSVPARYGVGFVFTVIPKPTGEQVGAQPPLSAPPLPRRSAAHWREALGSYPRLTCSDAHLSNYFDYQLYGLHLNRLQGGPGQIKHPAVAGGVDGFHLPLAHAVPGHMMEARWCADPEIARGSLLNFLEAQRPDGSLPGRLYPIREERQGFYHANWGDAVQALDVLHPQKAFLETAYGGLSRYADWLHRERDPESSGMITVAKQHEAGQEYTSRYLALHPESDVEEAGTGPALKGVDVTVYAYQLLRSLEDMAARLGYEVDADRWRGAADRTGTALLDHMWDPGIGFFTDVDAASGLRTGVKAAVGFYPLLTDLLDDDIIARLLDHLNDTTSFALPFPVPSSPADDPFFSAEGLWKGKRHAGPWNGRVWPTTNSHVIEGLLRQWHRGRREVGATTARILRRFVGMMFHQGDPKRPNSCEHYNPVSGHPSAFRGIDDHQHFWVADLLVRGVAGLDPTGEALHIRPLPMDLEHVTFRGRVRQHEVLFTLDGEDMAIAIDGRMTHGHIGEPLEVSW